ncbi:hypothetical protein [Streptosporangium sp. H16]|uniref:hypothetical protein n=1 Tax=Streptosporangium sp. H16 TaxID=3444184 RepID=UPI003F78B29C
MAFRDESDPQQRDAGDEETARRLRAHFQSALEETIDESTAASHDQALCAVQRLLTERGIRAQRHTTISLGLYGDHLNPPNWPNRPDSRSWMNRHPPELAVTGPQGWRDVTVTVGSRSGCYLVSIRNGPDLQTVGREHPEKVVDLILAARRS